MTELALMVTS